MEWRQNGIPFVVTPKPPWHREFRKRWLDVTTQHGTPWHEKLKLFNELQIRLCLPEGTTIRLTDSDFGELINFILSCVEGRPIASREQNLIALTNSFLSASARKRYADVARKALLVTGNAAVLERQSVRDKLHLASRCLQAEEFLSEVGGAIFPDLFENGPL
jgi:hypothetical protein